MALYPRAIVRRLTVLLTALGLALAVLAGSVTPAGAQSDTTPGLAEARRRADDVAGELNRLQTELGELDGEMQRAEAEAAATGAERDRLRDQVRDLAIRRYTQLGDSGYAGAELNEQGRAAVLLAAVTGDDLDAVDQLRATNQRFEATAAELAERRGEQEAALGSLQARRAELDEQLTRLEALERQRLAEEQRRREEEARQAAEAEARARAAEQAALLAAQRDAAAEGQRRAQATSSSTAPASSAPSSTAGSSGATSAPAPTTTTTAPSGPPGGQQIASGAWVCPVQGARSFVDSWGFARPGGRAHQGVDIMSPRGTPVVLPVAGTVSFKSGGIGGLSFRLNGDDGNWYYGAHLDSFAGVSGGHFPAGTVVGYVGDTGDARGTGTHLHFEIHIGGYGNAVNPYPTTRAHC